jgi:hypothetical protein
MTGIFEKLLDFVPSRKTSFIVLTAAATTLIFSEIAKRKLNPAPKQIIPSPRASLLPSLSKEGQEELPYPPDVFPGPRDVASPVS